jgi:hypothetical protein
VHHNTITKLLVRDSEEGSEKIQETTGTFACGGTRFSQAYVEGHGRSREGTSVYKADVPAMMSFAGRTIYEGSLIDIGCRE